MENKVITKENEQIKAFFCSLDKMLDKIETALADCRPTLKGERFLTDTQVSERLKVSRRTLQEYRTEGRIPYTHFGGKTLYRESDIQKILDKGYREA